MAVDYQVRLSELTLIELETSLGVFSGYRSDILKLSWPFLGPRPDDPDNALTFQMKSAQDTPESPYWTEAPYRSTIYLQTIQTTMDTSYSTTPEDNWYTKKPLASTPFDIGTKIPPDAQPTEDEFRKHFSDTINLFADAPYQGDIKKAGSVTPSFYAYSMFSGNSLFGSMFIDIPENVRNPLNITPLPGKYGEEWPWWSAMNSSEGSLFNALTSRLFADPGNLSVYGVIGRCKYEIKESTPGVSVDVVRLDNSVIQDQGNTYTGIITPIDKPLDFLWLNYESFTSNRIYGYYWGATRIWFGIEENTQEATT